MNTTEVDTCHCLVRHPKSAKFLVVKHDESWSPPVLKFPLSAIDFRASDINQGMLDKYGLKTRVLRPLIRLNHFHCVELELAAQKPSRKLQAVWVDREEYLRTRTPPGDVPDAFEIWLDEQHEGLVPENRPPFHQPGCFNVADHWIHFELDKLGVQVLGSVEQFRVGWPSSCLMQVRTSQGYYFFKAGFGDQPVEAKLTVALARHLPDTVFMPAAVDLERNWMLNAGFFDELKPSFNLEQLPLFAQAMAKLQVESASQIDEWQNLDVKKLAEPEFLEFCAQGDRYLDRWTEGGGGL